MDFRREVTVGRFDLRPHPDKFGDWATAHGAPNPPIPSPASNEPIGAPPPGTGQPIGREIGVFAEALLWLKTHPLLKGLIVLTVVCMIGPGRAALYPTSDPVRAHGQANP